MARTAAFMTVWTTCQEYCAGTSFADAWARVAQTQFELDPHKRSTSLHNCASNPIPAWRGEAWYGHVTLQQGHHITSTADHWLQQYNADPPRVLVEDEVRGMAWRACPACVVVVVVVVVCVWYDNKTTTRTPGSAGER